MEEPGRLRSLWLQTVRHEWACTCNKCLDHSTGWYCCLPQYCIKHNTVVFLFSNILRICTQIISLLKYIWVGKKKKNLHISLCFYIKTRNTFARGQRASGGCWAHGLSSPVTQQCSPPAFQQQWLSGDIILKLSDCPSCGALSIHQARSVLHSSLCF